MKGCSSPVVVSQIGIVSRTAQEVRGWVDKGRRCPGTFKCDSTDPPRIPLKRIPPCVCGRKIRTGPLLSLAG